MRTIQKIASSVALIGFASMVTACGPSSSNSNSEEPSVASERNEPGYQLMAAQHKISVALNQSGVTTTANTAASGCALSAGSAGSNQLPVFQNLQDELQKIEQDVQNQSANDLSQDLQAFQDALMQDLNDLLAQIQACIPASASLPPSAATPPSQGPPNIPNFNFQQFLGQQGLPSLGQTSIGASPSH